MPRKRNLTSDELAAWFWSNVDHDGPTQPHMTTPCWLWTACLRKGYGRLRWDGGKKQAHRVAWEVANGPIPDGLIACHHCDTRNCCRPDHLFLGDDDTNAKDRDAKGRRTAPRGELVGGAKLTVALVVEIRGRAAAGESQSALAAELGVSRPAVGRVIRRETWKHAD